MELKRAVRDVGGKRYPRKMYDLSSRHFDARRNVAEYVGKSHSCAVGDLIFQRNNAHEKNYYVHLELKAM